jgi:hypothetical protein
MLLGMGKEAHFAFTVLSSALLSALAGACVEPAGADHIVGPDGTQMLHVHCGDEQVACFQLAGELCPRGYYLSPVFDPHDGNFLVRCKDPAQASVVASVAPQPAPTQPVQAAVARAHQPEDGWPPAEVARPAEPWPAPSASSAVPRTASGGVVDIGY